MMKKPSPIPSPFQLTIDDVLRLEADGTIEILRSGVVIDTANGGMPTDGTNGFELHTWDAFPSTEQVDEIASGRPVAGHAVSWVFKEDYSTATKGTIGCQAYWSQKYRGRSYGVCLCPHPGEDAFSRALRYL